ncbi:MAG TPA: enolase C-terminal domain-like protein [Microvirga sp.]|jgi:mandelate racemase|nr:enolase C-terminal domain-like protein [Microvirga sp.]
MNMPVASSVDGLTVRDVSTKAVSVPLTFALGTSAAVVREAPLLLADLRTEEGIVGRGYVFAYTPSGARAIAGHLHEAVALVKGQAIAPRAIARTLGRRFALLGVTGTARMALSLLDMALWDALAIAGGMPLARMLGGTCTPVRAYNSSGLGLMAPDAAVREAGALLERGFEGVKLRLGYPTLNEDLAVLRAVRRGIPESVALMVDYNQALTLHEALARGRALQEEGIAWLEEPIRHDDWRGNAALAAELRVPLQIGENFNGPEDLAEALRAGACDLVMPDLARIGGVSGWIDAAGAAAASGVGMSSHLMPEVSAHLLAATPTAHWLEYVDWADAILQEPLAIAAGRAVLPDRPGHGMAWDEAKLAKLRAL